MLQIIKEYQGNVRVLNLDEFEDEIRYCTYGWQRMIINKLIECGRVFYKDIVFRLESKKDRMMLKSWWRIKNEK